MSDPHETEDGPALKRDVDVEAASKFAALVKAVGGSTAAGRILKRSRGAVEQWATGRRRLPFADYLALAVHADALLDRLPPEGDEEITASRLPPMQMVQTFGGGVPEGYVSVPSFDVRASAGAGAMAPSALDQSDVVAFREPWLRSLGLIPGRVHVLWATGDSMTPTIRDGDMLLVDRTIDRVVNDGIYIVVVGGAVVVKRIQIRHNGAVALKSDNTRYDEQTVPADEVPQLVVEGRVRWVGGPI